MTEPVCFMCGALEDEAERLFRGIQGWICDDCVRECGQLLLREDKFSTATDKES